MFHYVRSVDMIDLVAVLFSCGLLLLLWHLIRLGLGLGVLVI